jgi:hypothetical protein
MKSEFVLCGVLARLQYFNPTAIYIDDKLIWDDNKSVAEGWIPYDYALRKYGDTCAKTVRHIDIKVVDFHHTILEIYTTDY